MEKFNETQPQDGNQVVISKNTGTINIENNSKDAFAAMQNLISNQREMNEMSKDFFESLKQFLYVAKKSLSKENKKKRK